MVTSTAVREQACHCKDWPACSISEVDFPSKLSPKYKHNTYTESHKIYNKYSALKGVVFCTITELQAQDTNVNAL